MYYDESSKSITDRPMYKAAIAALDRWIAHAYAPGGRGYVELSLLVHKTGEPASAVLSLMGPFEAAGIVRRYERVVCDRCHETYDPADGQCLNCDAPLSSSIPTDQVCYAVQGPPQEPAFDPRSQDAAPDIFISYRRADSAVLAADLYYMLRSQGRSVFLDDCSLSPGDDAERAFLRAASHVGYFIYLASRHYFESEFCKQEIAHAARAWRRLIRVNIAPAPAAPAEMPWADGPNWLQVKGSNEGLRPGAGARPARGTPNADGRHGFTAAGVPVPYVGDVARRDQGAVDASAVALQKSSAGQFEGG